MIIIKTNEFEMVQSSETGPFFNLSLLSTINEGKENERKEMKLISYGLPFETCMKHIVGSEMSKLEGTLTATEYIEKYKEIVEKISKLITHVDKVIEKDNGEE